MNPHRLFGSPSTPASLGAVLLAAALLAGANGCGRANSRPPGDTEAPSAIMSTGDITRAATADLTSGVAVSGTLAPSVDIRIAAPYAEVLEEVTVKEGQSVRRGQVLARFRTDALKPAAAGSEARRRVADADLTRMRNLYAEGAIPLRDVESADAALRAAEAELASSDKKLGEAVVTAPVDGVVAERFVQAGNRVMEGDALFRLVNTRQLEFEATVPGEASGEVRPGARVVLDVAGFATGAVRGTVARVNATADPATRRVKVYVSVPNEDGRLVGDLFASGVVVTDERKAALAVPSAAVRRDAAGHAFAWFISGGVLARREITPGITDDAHDLVEITGGIAAGDTIIIGPAENLVEGRKVHLTGATGGGSGGA